MSEEEKEKLEQEFQYALDNIVNKIKGEVATAIVQSEQSMILLFKKLIFKIEKQQKEIAECQDALTNTISKHKIKAKIEEIGKIEAHKIKAGKILSREEYNRAEFAIESLVELMEE